MEILILVLFYYLSQNPDFSKSVQPLMEKLKDSEQMLNFLKDLSSFTQAFSSFNPSTGSTGAESPKKDCNEKEKKAEPCASEAHQNHQNPKTQEKNPQSPTQGIADEFIQNILESYLNKTASSNGKTTVDG